MWAQVECVAVLVNPGACAPCPEPWSNAAGALYSAYFHPIKPCRMQGPLKASAPTWEWIPIVIALVYFQEVACDRLPQFQRSINKSSMKNKRTHTTRTSGWGTALRRSGVALSLVLKVSLSA